MSNISDILKDVEQSLDQDINTGKFTKGNKAAAKKKKEPVVDNRKQVLIECYKLGAGDPFKLVETILSKAHELELELPLVLKLSEFIAPYVKAKMKADTDDERKVILNIQHTKLEESNGTDTSGNN